jgi:molecular chaperone DnaJ
MARRRDYYEILGLNRSATQVEIKRAFRRLARRHHPDVNPNDRESEARFKEIAEAYAILGDPDRRAQYDRYGEVLPTVGVGGDLWEELTGFGDLFEAFFGTGRARGRPRARRGADLRYDVQITLEEVATGAKKAIASSRVQTCEECEGTGSRSKAPGRSCPRCGGAGQVQHTTATPFGRLSTVTACQSCGGEGAVVLDPCPSCEGAGRRVGKAKLSVTIPPVSPSAVAATCRHSPGGSFAS